MEEESQVPPGIGAQGRSQADPEQEVVWSFRGYRLRASEFTTAMAHFFRAEVQRANVWRQRLDTTTNWAVISTGAAITIAFNQNAHHGVIILNTLLVTLFAMIEARRYRYYELWSYRVRLMETDFFAAMLVPPFHPAADWAESLAENLLHPDFPISVWEAFGRRLRRNFIWIYLILGLAWLAKTILLSAPEYSMEAYLSNAAVGPIPGWVALLVGLGFYIGIILVAFLTSGLQQASGEVLPRYHEGGKEAVSAGGGTAPSGAPAWFRISRRRQQLLATIITDQSERVGRSILNEMRRGVTALQGTGMYTGKSHSVLMCALTATEVNLLKTLVNEQDPNAFIIVSPAQEVLGRGFLPIVNKEK